jgi:hypothetical protein
MDDGWLGVGRPKVAVASASVVLGGNYSLECSLVTAAVCGWPQGKTFFAV